MAAGSFLVSDYNHPDYNRPRPCPADLTPPIQKSSLWLLSAEREDSELSLQYFDNQMVI